MQGFIVATHSCPAVSQMYNYVTGDHALVCF